MRKRGLPYVLAAMMLIGSTGIGGNYVRADEPAVTEEGKVETTGTEEPIEEITENVTEEVAEEETVKIEGGTTEELIEDTTEDLESDTTTDVIEVTSEMIYEDDQAPSNWYKDYDYDLVDGYIKLKKYNGTATPLGHASAAILD